MSGSTINIMASESTVPLTTDNDLHLSKEHFRRKMSVIGGFTSFSSQKFNQLTSLFSTLEQQVGSLTTSNGQNTKLIEALEGIGNILEQTEKEHKILHNHPNEIDIDSINFKRNLANLSMHDLDGILDIIHHGDKPREQKSDKFCLSVISIISIISIMFWMEIESLHCCL